MTTISTLIRTEAEGYHEVELEVRFVKRSFGGWAVTRKDNGRHLGWLVKHDDLWEARANSGAFRGEGIDDEGYILDDVPLYLFNGITSLKADACGYGKTREDATSELLWHLHRNHAPALGYGRHHAVKPYTR